MACCWMASDTRIACSESSESDEREGFDQSPLRAGDTHKAEAEDHETRALHSKVQGAKPPR